jgi:hypothetical protein
MGSSLNFMEKDEVIDLILSSREEFKLAFVHLILVNLIASISVAFATFTEISVRTFPGLFSFLAMTALILLYLGRNESDRMTPLKIGLGFSTIAALNFLVGVIGSLVFAPMTFFMILDSLIIVPTAFLTSSGIFYLIESFNNGEVNRMLALNSVALIPAYLAKQIVVSGSLNFSRFVSFIIQSKTVSALITIFIASYSVINLLEDYKTYKKESFAPAVLISVGVMGLLLNYIGLVLTPIYFPDFSQFMDRIWDFNIEALLFSISGIILWIELNVRRIF